MPRRITRTAIDSADEHGNYNALAYQDNNARAAVGGRRANSKGG